MNWVPILKAAADLVGHIVKLVKENPDLVKKEEAILELARLEESLAELQDIEGSEWEEVGGRP